MASKATWLNDMELELRTRGKVSVDVSAMEADDSDSQKSIIRHHRVYSTPDFTSMDH